MIRTTIHHIPLWQFELLKQEEGILHYTSSRFGGVSKGIYATFNQSFTAGDRKESVTENRRRLVQELEITPGMLLFPGQTHTAHVRVIRSHEDLKDPLTETDALVSDLPEVCLSVLTADCVPLLLYDPEKKAVAAAHAGWRGTVQSIALETVDVMKEQFGCRPQNIRAGIGPSIGPKNYEVGGNVVRAVHDNPNIHTESVIKKKSNGKALLNLWEANRQQLLIGGLKEDHVEMAGICTFESHETFFSARRLGNPCGRFASGIMIGGLGG
ncbi:MAG: peptidoglycan editing factor PgeF [Bacteroidales bacterium]|nr:peptidoglycan editing factor PgeF [Bacteroidales bacterium]